MIISLKETGEVIILLYYTENVTLKQTLNRACLTAQRLASRVRELTATLQSHPFKDNYLPFFFHLKHPLAAISFLKKKNNIFIKPLQLSLY